VRIFRIYCYEIVCVRFYLVPGNDSRVSNSLKLSVKKNTVLPTDAERLSTARCRVFRKLRLYRGKSSFRSLRFTRPRTLSATDRCYKATARNSGCCKDILSRRWICSADTAAEKNVPTPTTFPADRLSTLYSVALGRLTENVPREINIPNACTHSDI